MTEHLTSTSLSCSGAHGCSTWKIQDKEERAKANQAIVAGPLKEKLEQLAGLLVCDLYSQLWSGHDAA